VCAHGMSSEPPSSPGATVATRGDLGSRSLPSRASTRVSPASAPAFGHCGVQPRRLHDALVTLSSESATVSDRDSAARQLLRELTFLAPLCLSRCLPSVARAYQAVRARSMLDDAIQHVATVATTGRARFRGTHPAEAVAWCSSVLANQVRSELRWQSRHRHIEPLDSVPPMRAAAADARIAVSQLRQDLLHHLERTRTPRAAQSLFRAACCYLDHLTGTSLDRQIERWAGESEQGASEKVEMRRARNRIYQYHRRGRRVLNELLEPTLVGRLGSRAQQHSARLNHGRNLDPKRRAGRAARSGARVGPADPTGDAEARFV
jgi:hypothetical protein